MKTCNLAEQGTGEDGARSTRASSIKKLIPLQGMEALDLGAKEGYNAFDLVESGCSGVVGVEIRDRFLEQARQEQHRLGYDNVRFIKGDVQHIDKLGLPKFDICLCSGLLYHMQNPFNVLKRISHICKILVLETHIAPNYGLYYLSAKKYRQYLSHKISRVTLDDEIFHGRFNTFPDHQNMAETSGSVVSRSTFWLTRRSLSRALGLAGYRIAHFYYGRAGQKTPSIDIAHGFRRTKVFMIAEVVEPAQPSAKG